MISSCRQNLDVLYSSDLEGFNLGLPLLFMAMTVRPIHVENKKNRIISLQSNQHCHNLPVSTYVPLVVLVTFCLANLECCRRILSGELYEQVELKGACFYYVLKMPSD